MLIQPADPTIQLVYGSAIAGALLIAGVCQVLFSPKALWERAAYLGLAYAFAVLLPWTLLGVESKLWFACITLTAVGVAIAGRRGFWHACARWILRQNAAHVSRTLGCVALGLSLSGWCGLYFLYHRAIERSADEAFAHVTSAAPTNYTTVAKATTDAGHPLDLEEPVEPLDIAELEEIEQTSAAVANFADWTIRRSVATDASNCHGWVFTGGKYCIGGRYVEQILADNSYSHVPTPQPGDLVVYRDANQQVSHTGLVRAVLQDSEVLVESKWGRLGVYLHPAGKSCYGTQYGFYRSGRGTHLLNVSGA